MVMQKQSIVTILESERNISSSLMKNTDSSKELSHSKATSDIWSSILNQKEKDEASKFKSAPYIHPLVKKSKSFLSEKSLQICTESLGSETGSDGFSSYSYTSFEDNNSEDDGKMKEKVKTCDEEISKYNKNYSVKNKPRCFPPPLPSLTSQSQHGQSQPLQMRPHRNNGRLFLFLQVVSIPSHNNFFAKRQNGRLILTFANNKDGEDEEEKDDENVTERSKTLELMVNKPIGLVNKSPKWSEKFNQVPSFKDAKIVQHGSMPWSLNIINAYQNYWQTKATRNVAPLVPNDTIVDQQSNYSFIKENSISNKVVVTGSMNIYQASNDTPHELFVLRGKNGEYLVHNLKCYKDSKTRRSFLFWDPSRIVA